MRAPSGPIKAKYFIQSKTVVHGGNVKYELGAVIPAYGQEDEGPDNGYHQATPSGEALLHYHVDRDGLGLEPDTHVMLLWHPLTDEEEPPEDGWWILKSRTEYEHGLVEYRLEPCGAARPFSWKTEFEVTVDRGFKQAEFGSPGQRFTLETRTL